MGSHHGHGRCPCGARGQLFGGYCVRCVGKGALRSSHADFEAQIINRHRYEPVSHKGHGRHLDHRLSAAERRGLPPEDFALPHRHALPLDTLKRTRNAGARLEQMRERGSVSEHEYREAAHRIAAASIYWGINSKYIGMY